MDSKRGQQLKRIIQFSQDMLAEAGENQWQRVAEIEAERRALVERCFQQPSSEQDAPEVAAAIREVLHLNQELARLARQFQNQLGSDIRTHNVGRAATAAYLNHTR